MGRAFARSRREDRPGLKTARIALFSGAVVVTPVVYDRRMPCTDHAAKRLRARELRRAGWSRAQIAREVGVRNMRSIDRWLAGIPTPVWTRRPQAKDGVRSEAVKLRREGKTYDEIRRKLGVSKSSLSLWLRDLYLTDEQRDVLLSKLATAPMRRGATNRARREAVRAGIRARAAEEIRFVTDRELFLLGAILYWAEGAKAKMWRPSQCVSFINSDPRLVRLFLHWLHGFGIPRSRFSFRISIHESADLAAADRSGERSSAPEKRVSFDRS